MVAIAIILLLSLAEVFTAGRLYLLFFFSLPRTYQQSHGPLHHHRLKLQLRLWTNVLLFPDLLPEGLFRHGGLLHPFLSDDMVLPVLQDINQVLNNKWNSELTTTV